MPEREYFSLRYAIPGFSFLLFVVLLNHVPLLKVLTDSDFGTFLGFLSLSTGSAIGFIISQFWFLRFSGGREIFGIYGFESLRDFLIEECRNYGLIDETQEHPLPLGAILDYVRHQRKENEATKVAERRWDIYHVLSSTIYSLIIGTIVGIGLRIYYEWFLFEPRYELSLEMYISTSFSENPEAVALVVIFTSVIILLFVLHYGRRRLMANYRPLFEAFIRHEIRTVGDELPIVFPDFFESNDNPD